MGNPLPHTRLPVRPTMDDTFAWLLGQAAKASGPGPSNDMKAFRDVFSQAKKIVVLSGAGMSAESGVPTFRYSGMHCTLAQS